jgi:hypothetical protein
MHILQSMGQYGHTTEASPCKFVDVIEQQWNNTIDEAFANTTQLASRLKQGRNTRVSPRRQRGIIYETVYVLNVRFEMRQTHRN